ncbi:MAG: homocysteine S-methyltransferase family protein [candidate division NC10 bacterium]|nr:homocysteine S-methyltransferase family protein [candidate division NC10 bacterium]
MEPRGKEFLERLKSEVLVFDGAMGTMLFEAGLVDGACPELWNETHADIVRTIHEAYFDAGSDFVETNTFGGTRLKLQAYGLADRTRELNVLGARLARSVCPPGKYVAGSIGPTGHLPDTFEPLGDTSEEEFYANFREQALALAEGGVDLFAIETMMYPEEAVIAIRAARESTGLPVMCTMFFQWEKDQNRDRTMWGTSPEEAARILFEAGADVVGCNCGDGGPGRAAAIIQAMRGVSDGLLITYPNAGLPRIQGGRTIYELPPDEMAAGYPPILDAGANIVGACCGSTPTHIARLAEVVRRRRTRSS